MFCRKCGNQMPDGEKFCNQCGAPASPDDISPLQQQPPVMPGYPAGAEQGGAYVPPTFTAGDSGHRTEKPKTASRKKLRTLLIIAGGVLVLAAAVLIPVLIEKAHSDRYEAAFAMMDSGDFEEAKAGFLELGEYRESPDMAEECQDTMDYNDAVALQDAGEYKQARDAFAALGSFKDADDKSAECQNTMDYNDAVALMDAGSNEEARYAFTILGSFMDSADLATECQNRIDYDAAAALMEENKFEAALAAFSSLGYYSDASDMVMQCQDNIDYLAADAAFNDGKFYTAFMAFYDLGDFKDSVERCFACIQDPPKNGELYHNPDFAKKVSVTFKVGDQDLSAFIKVYSEDDQLVASIFVAKNSKTKVKLPKGKYRFKAAYGIEWFGEKELFGDNAIYTVMVFKEGDTLNLSSNTIYTISLLQEGEGNMTSMPESLGNF